MSLIEFIGFIISFLAMIVLFFRRAIEKRRSDQDPEYYEKMEQQKEVRMREFLRSLNIQHEEDDREEYEEVDDEDDELVFHEEAVRQPSRKENYSPMALSKPRRTVHDEFQFKSKIEQYRPQTAIERRTMETNIEKRYLEDPFSMPVVSHDMAYDADVDPYAIVRQSQKNRLAQMIDRLESPQEMVILHELIGPPKALR
jgi:hypothetical protein